MEFRELRSFSYERFLADLFPEPIFMEKSDIRRNKDESEKKWEKEITEEKREISHNEDESWKIKTERFLLQKNIEFSYFLFCFVVSFTEYVLYHRIIIFYKLLEFPFIFGSINIRDSYLET